MNFQCDIVLDCACRSARLVQFSPHGVVSGLHLEQLGERLYEAGPAGHEGLPSLIKDEWLRRNWTAGHDTERACGNRDELSVGYMGQGAVISYEWKVRASGDFFRMLLFVDLEFGYPYNMIVLQGQFHGLAKGDNSRRD